MCYNKLTYYARLQCADVVFTMVASESYFTEDQGRVYGGGEAAAPPPVTIKKRKKVSGEAIRST